MRDDVVCCAGDGVSVSHRMTQRFARHLCGNLGCHVPARFAHDSDRWFGGVTNTFRVHEVHLCLTQSFRLDWGGRTGPRRARTLLHHHRAVEVCAMARNLLSHQLGIWHRT